MKVYEELVARGLIAQVTDEEEIKELINTGKATFYIGFDPTAVAAVIVLSAWSGGFLPVDGLPAMIMGMGNYKLSEFWKFVIPMYIITIVAMSIGAVVMFPM